MTGRALYFSSLCFGPPNCGRRSVAFGHGERFYMQQSSNMITTTLRLAVVRETAPNGLQNQVGATQLGQNRKWPHLNGKSVLPSEADIVRLLPHVRFVPILLQKSKIEQL